MDSFDLLDPSVKQGWVNIWGCYYCSFRNLAWSESPYLSQTLVHGAAMPNPLCIRLSAAQQDDDVDEQQADEDEGEVDEQLLQVPLGLWVHLDLRRSADGRLGHVLNALHGDGGPVRFWIGWIARGESLGQAAEPVWAKQSWADLVRLDLRR